MNKLCRYVSDRFLITGLGTSVGSSSNVIIRVDDLQCEWEWTGTCLLIIFTFYMIIVILIFCMRFSRIFGGRRYRNISDRLHWGKCWFCLVSFRNLSIKSVWSIQEGFSALIKKYVNLLSVLTSRKTLIQAQVVRGLSSAVTLHIHYIHWRATVCLYTNILLLQYIYSIMHYLQFFWIQIESF